MMNCADARDRLEPLVLGFLEPGEARDCEAHVAFCDACRTRQAEIEDLLGLLGRLADAPASRPGLEERILARTSGTPRPVARRWGRAGLAAAAGLLAAAGLAAAGFHLGRLGGTPDVTARLDAQQRTLDDLRSGLADLRQSETRRAAEGRTLARLQAQVGELQAAHDVLRKSRRTEEEENALADRMKDQEGRIKDLEKQLADTVAQLTSLRDQTINTFLKVASAVSNPLVGTNPRQPGRGSW
jgi:hypothetical protein